MFPANPFLVVLRCGFKFIFQYTGVRYKHVVETNYNFLIELPPFFCADVQLESYPNTRWI